MKNVTKFFVLAILLLSFAASTFAQSATATATATILTPITLSKVTDMNFGNIFASVAGGTVLLNPNNSRTPTGVTVPATPGTVTAAQFTVNGTGTATYAITLPGTDYTITRVSGSETMIVNTFTSTPSVTGVLTAGTQTLSVGATLNVGANQVAGIYTNATGFTVTVNYN